MKKLRTLQWAPVALVIGLIAWQLHVAGPGGVADGATLLEYGARKPNFGFPQAPWRLFASMFLHGGWVHVFANSVLIYLWGSQVCRLSGTLGFLSVFFLSGLWGSLLSDIYGPEALAVGSSGGSSGLVLFVLVLALLAAGKSSWQGQGKSWLQVSAAAVVLNVVMALGLSSATSGRLDHWAHAGGALAGLLLGLAASSDKESSRKNFFFALLSLSLVAAAIVWKRGPSPFG